MTPPEDHPDKFVINKILLPEQLQNAGPENFRKNPNLGILGHDIKIPAVHEEPVGNYRMDVGMPAAVIAESLDSQYRAGNPFFLSQDTTKKSNQAFVGALAEFAEQFSVVLEKNPQDFRYAEYILAVGNRIENILLQVNSELRHLFGMA